MTVTHRTQYITSIQRDAWIEINILALERNFEKIKGLVKTDIMAVVKADAYGHGAATLGPVLQSLGVNSFGVATVDEGISLRAAGIKVPILILGATPFWASESCIENNLTISVYSKEQIKLLEESAKKADTRIKVQIKIDTGMNRLGISYKDSKKEIEYLINNKSFEVQGIFSHLSTSHNTDFSLLQKERYDKAIEPFKNLNLQRHLANSYAAINYPDFRYNLVRTGIALYGEEFNFLEPVLSLKGRITHLNKISSGKPVSYDRTWSSKEESTIATIPIGYADGVDKKLSNRIFGKLNNNQVEQAGNITMDQMMFNVTRVNNPQIGDVITLLDNELTINSWAKTLDTISYELLCRLKMRLPRIYTRE